MSEAKSNSAAGENATGRKKRYARTAAPTALLTLTPTKVAMLRFLAEMRFLSLPQLARLCCPAEREDLSRKSARKHLRALFDAGLVNVLPVSRLAPVDALNDETLLYGSAPNIYVPAAEGLQMLYKAGLICREWAKRPPAAYGPKNSLFLAHELQVRDMRVWLEGCARASGGEQHVLIWKDGQEAAIEFGRDSSPGLVRPDAWFAYRIDERTLVSLLEIDRGTERGTERWEQKLAAYGALFASGQLAGVTGYVNARVLVIAPSERRRDWLGTFVAGQAEPQLARRFWLSTPDALNHPVVGAPCWQQPGSASPQPLVKNAVVK